MADIVTFGGGVAVAIAAIAVLYRASKKGADPEARQNADMIMTMYGIIAILAGVGYWFVSTETQRILIGLLFAGGSIFAIIMGRIWLKPVVRR